MSLYWAPFLGAIVFELFHWYQLREKLDGRKYQKLLRSKGYWVITVLFTLGASAVVAIYFEGRLTTPELVAAGAALPTTLKKLIATATARQETKLGPEDEDKAKWSDYFYYS